MNTAVSAHLDNQLRILRVTLELTSPLALASGDSSGLFDSPCAVDANGLPCLPGTSLAGAMRAWWRTQLNATHLDQDWFGFVPMGDQGAAAQRSRLHISMGHIHNAKNQPVDKPTPYPQLQADPILGTLLGAHMPVRDHVRLNDRGAAADNDKFDRSHVPAGHCFTFQIQLRLRTDNAKSWEAARNALLAALKNGDIMLGGATRAGLGHVKATEARELVLKLPADIEKVSAHQSLTSKLQATNLILTAQPSPTPSPTAPIKIDLELAALDLWRVGSSGAKTLVMADGRQPDTQPYSEHRVIWQNWQAKVETREIVPGAGIKGALAHRTTFHLNRRSGRWATQEGAQAPLTAVTALFGQALDDGSGHAGCVHVSDSVLLPTEKDHIKPKQSSIQHLPHVRLDRFTGGAWNGALFSESLLFLGGITLKMRIDPQRLLAPHSPATGEELLALADALADLGEGRLSLGAGVARGLGRFNFIDKQAAKKALVALKDLGDKIRTQRAQPANTTDQPTPQVQAHA